MKDIQGKLLPFNTDSIEKAVLILETKVLKGFERAHYGSGIATVQIPPEGTGFKRATEGGNALCYSS